MGGRSVSEDPVGSFASLRMTAKKRAVSLQIYLLVDHGFELSIVRAV
jgi:hypothetical protein